MVAVVGQRVQDECRAEEPGQEMPAGRLDQLRQAVRCDRPGTARQEIEPEGERVSRLRLLAERPAGGREPASEGSARPGGQSSDKGKPYPEWDYREGRYKRNWSWVQEKPLAESNLAEANRLTTQYALALKRLKCARIVVVTIHVAQ